MRSLVWTIGFALITVAATCAPINAANMAMPASMEALLGNWSCTYNGPKGTAKSTYEITKASDLWLHGTGENGAYGGRPANQSVFMIGYDPKKKIFVSMGGSSIAGDYGISTAKAPAKAMRMTYTNAWPADPTHERDAWTYSSTSISVATTWTEKGKAMKGESHCTKT